MYPFKFNPILKSTIWGGEKIIPFKHLNIEQPQVGESWEISNVPGDESVVANGTEAGKNLSQLVKEYKGSLVGESNYQRFGDNFPLLIKFIDACDDLSIQVHPDDELAKKRHNSMGKTEMWYVLDCEPGAFLYYGFDHEISKAEFEERIKNNTLTEVLNAVPVHKGDCFFIPAGTLHAICKGIVIAEVQQNSNVTYRVYDYGRVGADGKPRALHVEKALDVTLRTPPVKHDFGNHLAQGEYFTVDAKNGAFEDTADEKSFVSLLVTDGEGELTCGGETVVVKKGDSFFLPAGSGSYAVRGTCQTLVTRV